MGFLDLATLQQSPGPALPGEIVGGLDTSADGRSLLLTLSGAKLPSDVWVLDIETGKAKVVGNDPWMVPQRTLNPVWSPDSKWVAYSSRLKSMFHAIFISNVETGETKQVTLRVPVESLGFHLDDGTYLVEEGAIQVFVGGNSLAEPVGEAAIMKTFRIPPMERRASASTTVAQ